MDKNCYTIQAMKDNPQVCGELFQILSFLLNETKACTFSETNILRLSSVIGRCRAKRIYDELRVSLDTIRCKRDQSVTGMTYYRRSYVPSSEILWFEIGKVTVVISPRSPVMSMNNVTKTVAKLKSEYNIHHFKNSKIELFGIKGALNEVLSNGDIQNMRICFEISNIWGYSMTPIIDNMFVADPAYYIGIQEDREDFCSIIPMILYEYSVVMSIPEKERKKKWSEVYEKVLISYCYHFKKYRYIKDKGCIREFKAYLREKSEEVIPIQDGILESYAISLPEYNDERAMTKMIMAMIAQNITWEITNEEAEILSRWADMCQTWLTTGYKKCIMTWTRKI